MEKETVKVGGLPLQTQIQERANMEHVALRWIFGKQTRSLMLSPHILVPLKASTDVKVLIVEVMVVRDIRESVTKMVVT